MILGEIWVYVSICAGSKSAPIPLVSRVLGKYYICLQNVAATFSSQVPKKNLAALKVGRKGENPASGHVTSRKPDLMILTKFGFTSQFVRVVKVRRYRSFRAFQPSIICVYKTLRPLFRVRFRKKIWRRSKLVEKMKIQLPVTLPPGSQMEARFDDF